MNELPEIEIVLNPKTSEAVDIIGFQWAGDNIGKRSKIGGSPNWIQNPEWPKCTCNKKMTFYGQLDSIGDECNIADCGMIYVFLCFDCFETKSIIQSH